MILKVVILTVLLAGGQTQEFYYATGKAACGAAGEKFDGLPTVTGWHCLSSEMIEVH